VRTKPEHRARNAASPSPSASDHRLTRTRKGVSAPLSRILVLLIVLSFHASCTDKGIVTDAERAAVHQYSRYTFDPASSLVSRITDAPDFVLSYLREMDSREDYHSYKPDRRELRRIRQSLAALPPLTASVLRERLLGMYFIRNFMGGGLTDWVVDSSGGMYVFMVFNPESLRKSISSWLTYRENSCFKDDGSDTIITVSGGKRYSGFTYVLLHESTHAVDYVTHVTPYVEEGLRKTGHPRSTPFIDGIWKELRKPLERYDFPLRSSLTFYGLKDPAIPLSRAPELYRGLEQTPFASLYGSMSWAEDIAEFVFFHHLTRKLGQPYVIRVSRKGKLLYTRQPMNSPLLIERAATIQHFYR